MYTVAELCELCLKAAVSEKFTELTRERYERTVKRILKFAEDHRYVEFSEEFAEDYITNGGFDDYGFYKDGRYSKRDRLRFMNLFREQVYEGQITFRSHRKTRLEPETEYYRNELEMFVLYLHTTGIEENTIMAYRFPVYRMFQYYETNGITDTSLITVESMPALFEYFNQFFNPHGGLKNALCGLRAYARYAERDDLLSFFSKLKPRAEKKIIPCLNDDERKSLVNVLYSGDILLRDKAIVLLSLTIGIRASDIIALEFDNIDWHSGTISFVQEKTNNSVNDPGLAAVLNAIYDYIINERPKVSCRNIFLRSLAPYRPLNDHASIYHIIKRVFTKAEISFDKRICGTTFLRHNVTTHMLRQKIPQEVIASVVGHADINTTSIYMSADDREIAECMLPIIKCGDFHE